MFEGKIAEIGRQHGHNFQNIQLNVNLKSGSLPLVEDQLPSLTLLTSCLPKVK